MITSSRPRRTALKETLAV